MVNTTNLGHTRSRSDLVHSPNEAARYYDSSPQLATISSLAIRPAKDSASPNITSPDRPSRIPVSSSRLPSSTEMSPTSPPSPPLPSGPTHSRRTSKNYFPTLRSPSKGNNAVENQNPKINASSLPTLSAKRYDAAAHRSSARTGESVKAFIKADPPQKSPPLRSSRPRQPVSLATTSASRGKSASRFKPLSANSDASSAEATAPLKKRVPQPGLVDFAERRAKIQRAIIANLRDDSRSDRGSISGRSSTSGPAQRNSSISDTLASHGSADESPTTYDDNAHHRQNPKVPPPTGLGVMLVAANGNPVDPFVNGNASLDSSFEELASPNSHEEKAEVVQSILGSLAPDIEELEPGEPLNLLSQVMRMREPSESSTSGTDIENSPNFTSSPSPFEIDDNGSIQIILDDPVPSPKDSHWPLEQPTTKSNSTPNELFSTADEGSFTPGDPEYVAESVEEGFASDVAEVGSSPWLSEDVTNMPETPRKRNVDILRHDQDEEATPKQSVRTARSSVLAISRDWDRDSDSYSAVHRIIEQYRISGIMTPDMLHEFGRHVTKLSPDLSRIGDSDAGTMKILLDSLVADQYETSKSQPPVESRYSVTTLPSPADSSHIDSMDEEDEFRPGTAIIFSPLSKYGNKDETCYKAPQPDALLLSSRTVSISVSQLDGQPDVTLGALEDEDYRPTPPPKDEGYSPRSSTGHSYQNIVQTLPKSALHSRSPSPNTRGYEKRTMEPLRLPEIPTGQGLGLAISVEPPSTTTSVPPPLPHYAPPRPPSTREPAALQLDMTLQEVQRPSTAASSVPASPIRVRPTTAEDRFRNFSTPARPSMDSHKPTPLVIPPSHMTSSMQSLVRRPSLDLSSSSTQPPSPSPEQRRLTKRKNVIKELVDTEYSYHQDMKIIEDIYKATVGELITVDDKKTLFGNVDQVEAFSLEFYDALRRAVTNVYVPPKSSRWQTKRGSFSTNNSGDKESISETPDEERDYTTRIGEVFAHHLAHMEKVYGAYLRNHDAANQRLAKLQTDPTVKCWLAECHNNASDITSAWDLDSLLVKPVQRILKYPLLLTQLLESTPAGHPDHKALEYSVKEVMNVTHRINEAKKRADLVDQIVNRKRKESDVRSGLAKAFGRRTEKLKERVGIAEAYQDAEFDDLAHKFGGHFIRLQVCMRDFQGSVAELDKAVHRFLEFADALEAYIDVQPNTNAEVESKWRKFILAIRELATVALPDHKNKIQNHVIRPMLTAIELHKGPQDAINKRKKRIVDYAKCKAIEKNGQKPDKKTVEASELYEALNEQLKIDLPRLYNLTADLIKACLDSNVILQTNWMWLWKGKLAPVIDYTPRLDDIEMQESIHPNNILSAFEGEHDIVFSRILGLGICNGSLLADAANFLSPQTTLMGDESQQPSRATSRTRRPSNMSTTNRKFSNASEMGPLSPDFEKSFNGGPPLSPNMTSFPNANGQPKFFGRMRSSSSLSNQRGRALAIPQQPGQIGSARMPSLKSKSSFSTSRPSTANNRPPDLMPIVSAGSIIDTGNHSPRPTSGASYFTAQQDQGRFSGMFSSAMPMSDSPASSSGPTSPKYAPSDAPVMFVAASLFEFNIDRARREAGYPYLTYVEGEVFDVIGQKGELWLAKNQDDITNTLGWIWEQHFVILSQET